MYYMFVDQSFDYFTVKLHYGGRFSGNMELVPKISNCLGGKVDYVDNCGKDVMSLIELDHILIWLWYKYCILYYYTNKNGELVWCLIDQNVLEMCNSCWKDKEVEVFVKHIEVLHLAQSQIRFSNVYNQPSETVCEVEDSRTNVELEPNDDQTPQHEDNMKLEYKEVGRFIWRQWLYWWWLSS